MDIVGFYHHIKNNMMPDNVRQEAKGTGNQRRTADDWTLEFCECLMNGRKDVFGYDYKVKMHKQLLELKNDADVLCVAEVGRGLDILFSNSVKKWKKVICYDHNPIYDDYLHRYFDDSVEFHNVSTHVFVDNIDDYIKEKCIMVINHTHFRKFYLIKENKNIVHLIFNGDLI
jgi:hypothetical protein